MTTTGAKTVARWIAFARCAEAGAGLASLIGGRRLRQRLAIGTLAAIVLAPTPEAGADVCADFHAALAIKNAAAEAAKYHLLKVPTSPSKWETQDALNRASIEASDAVREAERAVRNSIENETAAGIIDAVLGIQFRISQAARAVVGGRGVYYSGPDREVYQAYGPLYANVITIRIAAREAHHEALIIACRLGLAED